LNYDYNLAAELKSITDQWGETLNYGFDSTGRLSNITGTGYPVSQFASNLQYRAWGTLKAETYGNGVTESALYDSRLQMTSFQLQQPGGQLGMSSSYQYYPDGQLKFSHSLDDRFDRAFSYDRLSRVSEAYSGSEARDFINGANSGPATGPYRQSYQYNALNQITQQTNRLWGDLETTTNTFVNNRLQAFGYDAAGRITQADGTTYTWDATGRIVSADSGTSHSSNRFDGNGRLLGTTLSSPGFRGIMRTTTVNYLSSTVLGGMVVAELSSAGQKTKSYVYAGKRKVAEVTANGVAWSHEEPISGSRGVSNVSGSYTPNAEFNADGMNVGLAAPVSSGFDIPEPMLLGGNLGFGSSCSVANPNCTTCYLDGFEHDCGHVMQLAEAGALQIQVQNRQGATKYVDVDTMLGSLYIPGHHEYSNEERVVGGWVTSDPNDPNSPMIYDPTLTALVSHINYFQAQFISPQQPAPGSFLDCFHRSGLANTYSRGPNDPDATHFTQAAANLLVDAHNAEGTSFSALAVTMMNEDNSFDLNPNPFVNVNRKGQALPSKYWDVGPFQLNQVTINAAISAGKIKNEGKNFIDFGSMFGRTVKDGQPFSGVPLANARIAARWLQVAGGNDRQRVINYAQRAGRGPNYDRFATLFDAFLNCYKR
jgi:YD repeat-containing protein